MNKNKYTEEIKNEFDEIFSDLKKKVNEIISSSKHQKEKADLITRIVASTTAACSRDIFNKMYLNLEKRLFETDDFADITCRNKFRDLNLGNEISRNYRFEPQVVDFKEADRIIRSLKIAGITTGIVAISEIGIILAMGLPISTLLTPIPISILVIAALSSALINYVKAEPKKFKEMIDEYLKEIKEQFIDWFDKIEEYFYTRVDEFKKKYKEEKDKEERL